MNQLLKGLEGVVIYIYMDVILVYGSNMKEHYERFSKVLHVLKENGLKVNDSKCHYHQSELKFLGQSISKDGVGISRDKVQKIHKGHQGITKCRERAHQSVWWLKIGKDIVKIVEQCTHNPTDNSERAYSSDCPIRQAMADAGRGSA